MQLPDLIAAITTLLVVIATFLRNELLSKEIRQKQNATTKDTEYLHDLRETVMSLAHRNAELECIVSFVTARCPQCFEQYKAFKEQLEIIDTPV